MDEYEYTEHWMQRIVDRLDRLIDIAERVEGQVLLPSEEEAKTVGDVLMDDACIPSDAVAAEPAKEPEPEHPAGPKPDPGEGYRLLSKNPPEGLQPGDECEGGAGQWVKSVNASTHRKQWPGLWYRRKIETPKPAWAPNVGDWVKVTRPKKQEINDDPLWLAEMDRFNGAVMQVEQFVESCQSAAVILAGYAFRVDWLSPAEPPEPEYRKPVLPADAGKECEFSDDGQRWLGGYLDGWLFGRNCWVSSCNNSWKQCRIRKDA